MLSTTDLLEIAKHRQGDVSDYRLAKLLGVPPTTVSNYRVGRSRPADSIAIKLAGLASLDPAKLIFSIRAERADDEAERDFWLAQLRRISSPDETEAAS